MYWRYLKTSDTDSFIHGGGYKRFLMFCVRKNLGVRCKERRSYSRAFGRMAVRAGLEGVRFHDLRHTFASLMLLRGAKPKVISEALGHSSVAFTMDVYSHIIEGMQSDAMALLDEVLPAGKTGLKNKFNAKLTPTF